jgi:DNA-binding MarR family transcriptional regulator
MSAQGSTDPHIELFRSVVALGMRMRAAMDRRLAEVGLTTQQAAVLTIAEGFGEAPTLGDVSRILGTSHQNTRQIADALVRKGLLEIRVDTRDRRVRRLVPTDAVAEVFGERDASDREAVRRWTRALSDADARRAASLLARELRDVDAFEA